LYVQLGGEKWATNAGYNINVLFFIFKILLINELSCDLVFISVLISCLFALPLLVIFSINNTVAIAYGRASDSIINSVIHITYSNVRFASIGTTSALPFKMIVAIFAIWVAGELAYVGILNYPTCIFLIFIAPQQLLFR
jgi:hypothetical protein